MPNYTAPAYEQEFEIPHRSGGDFDPSLMRSILDNLNVLQARMDAITAPPLVQEGGTGSLPTDGVELGERLPVVPSYLAEKASRGLFIDMRLLFPPNLGLLPRNRVSNGELERAANGLP